nr:putative endonuclease lcl3 [Quercus suber]
MPWPWTSDDSAPSGDEASKRPARSGTTGSWESVLNTNYTWQQNVVISVGSIATFLAVAHTYKRYLRRVPSVDYLTPASFRGRTLYGLVTRVGDGDNFHLFHAPGGRLLGWGWLPGRKISALTGKQLQGNTVHVRIAGVDAPEMAHFGRPAQPYGQEALDWLKRYVEGRWVRAIPHSRDRFDRVVCTVKRRRFFFFKTDVGLAMIRNGVATVYEAKTGSEFGGMEEKYRAAELKAKRRQVGMWGQKGLIGKIFGNSETIETPRQFKTRQRQEAEQSAEETISVVGSVVSAASGVANTVASQAATTAKNAVTNTAKGTVTTTTPELKKRGRTR